VDLYFDRLARDGDPQEGLSSAVGLGSGGILDEGTLEPVDLKILEELHLE
jgi:hypothetical protein